MLRIALTTTMFTLLALPSFADDWVADRLRGSVLVYQNEQWVPLKRGDIVSDDSYIKTLGDGRVQFSRGAETIDLAGHTMIQILDRDGQRFTNVHQHYGVIAVEAEKRDVNHFAIVTPYLAAVVKGTQFVVQSGSAGANVSVERGEVNVADPQTGTSTAITPGQSAGVDPAGRFAVSSTGGAPLPTVVNAAGEVLAPPAANASSATYPSAASAIASNTTAPAGGAAVAANTSNAGGGGNDNSGGNGNSGNGNGNSGSNGNSGNGNSGNGNGNSGNGGGSGNSGNGNGNSGSNGNSGNGNSGNGNGNSGNGGGTGNSGNGNGNGNSGSNGNSGNGNSGNGNSGNGNGNGGGRGNGNN